MQAASYAWASAGLRRRPPRTMDAASARIDQTTHPALNRRKWLFRGMDTQWPMTFRGLAGSRPLGPLLVGRLARPCRAGWRFDRPTKPLNGPTQAPGLSRHRASAARIRLVSL